MSLWNAASPYSCYKIPFPVCFPKAQHQKAYISGCDFCTSKVGEKGNTGLKQKQNQPLQI